ncbi:MAG: AIPR family protein [Anaerolineales bacterium]|nr:AIPR family protein [Hyphomicrobiaceae bacterium]MCW5596844.1 AIPR family protein [Rhodocyclaceae bacterium]MCW5887059.1 AIPR family protein [Anaerolineales bacterium]
MATDDQVEAFARELQTDVSDAVASGNGSPYEIEEFTRIVLERLADEGVLENPILLMQDGVFGRGQYSISGYSLSEEEDRLVLFGTLHLGIVPPPECSLPDLRRTAELAARFLWYSLRGLHEKIEPANTDASDLSKRLYGLSDRISHLKVVVLTDGRGRMKTIDLDEQEGTNVEVEVLGIEQLHRILGEGVSRDDIVVGLDDFGGKPLPCLDCGYEGDYQAYLAVMPAATLGKLYDKYGTRLLELNVRAFLGVRGRKSVNAGLRQTLAKEPRHFLAYNNGIVVTVDGIDLVKTGDGGVSISKLRGFQIVNGGQTTASIHRAIRVERVDVSTVNVPAKIILVESDDLSSMVSSISRCANSQNTVQPADFSANDPFHVAVEALASNTWLPDASGRWFYERARGSYIAAEAKADLAARDAQRFKRETPKERRFSKTDLAKYLNSWEGYPHHVAFGGQKNFQYYMQRLKEQYPSGFDPDTTWFKRLVAIAIMYRKLVQVVRRAKFPAYQANIVSYTLAWLGLVTGGRADFDLLWNRQTVSPELEAMFDTWAHSADAVLRSTAGARMPTEWAKKPDCWEALREAVPALPHNLPPELMSQGAAMGTTSSVRGTAPPLTAEDLMQIARVREIDATKWLQIANWGKRNRQTYRLAGIAATLAQYAADGWTRNASIKQAKWALELARMYQEKDQADESDG